ncbi:hypothetical protein ACHAWF_012048, partial [Thalassiosira exigua]
RIPPKHAGDRGGNLGHFFIQQRRDHSLTSPNCMQVCRGPGMHSQAIPSLVHRISRFDVRPSEASSRSAGATPLLLSPPLDSARSHLMLLCLTSCSSAVLLNLLLRRRLYYSR